MRLFLQFADNFWTDMYLYLPLVCMLTALLQYAVEKGSSEPLRRIGGCLFSCYILAVLWVTGVPVWNQISFEPTLQLIPFADVFLAPEQYVLNILLFVPFGFFLPLLWKRYRSLNKIATAGFLFSCAIETAQLFAPRITDVDDLMMNTAGAVLGYLLLLNVYQLRPGIRRYLVSFSAQGNTARCRITAEAAAYTAFVWLMLFFLF